MSGSKRRRSTSETPAASRSRSRSTSKKAEKKTMNKVETGSRAPSRSRSAGGKNKAVLKVPFLERLCLDAIKGELSPDNTKGSFFYLLSGIQLPVLLLLARFVIKDALLEQVTLINVGGHWLGFVIAELIGSNKWFDVTEDLVYLYSFFHTLKSIRSPTESQVTILLCAFVWIFRLVSFLGYRIIARGSDWRFDALIKNRAYNLFGWTCGGTWCVLNGACLWVVAGVGRTIDGPLTMTTKAGLAVFAFGLFLETLSDWQKFHFPGRGKKWIESGLWSLTRHPNYLGEITVWMGLAIACIGALKASSVSYRALALLAIVSPTWSAIFLFFTSMMLLEKRANSKFGKQAAYAQYKKQVPILLPFHL